MQNLSWDQDEKERRESNAPSVASPCIGVCRLDAQQVCLGCGRHIVEIAAAGVAAERARRLNPQETTAAATGGTSQPPDSPAVASHDRRQACDASPLWAAIKSATS